MSTATLSRKRKRANAPSVHREENVITIHRMNHPSCTSAFLWCLKDGIKECYTSFVIVWEGELVYPDACVPIAGIIAFFRENYGITFEYELPTNCYLEHCGFVEPFVKSEQEIATEIYPFDKIYRYSNSMQVAALTQAFIDGLSHQAECSEGVLSGLIWCINEVMDNVLLHSEAGQGFVMAQYHQAKKTIAICVYDSGIGIYKSLRKSQHRPRTEIDAISLAIQEGVGDGKGQGNGLFGLYQVVKENKGAFTITSGKSSIMWTPQQDMKKYDNLPLLSRDFHATAIDFRLNLCNAINIQNAFTTIGGFDGFDIRIDNMIQDDDSYVYDVYENGIGTATRESGEYLRNDVINTLSRINQRIVLDFNGVKTVSSSFADEFIAKMVLRLGFLQFNQLVKLINVNDDVKFLIERSLYMRISAAWKERYKFKNENIAD